MVLRRLEKFRSPAFSMDTQTNQSPPLYFRTCCTMRPPTFPAAPPGLHHTPISVSPDPKYDWLSCPTPLKMLKITKSHENVVECDNKTSKFLSHRWKPQLAGAGIEIGTPSVCINLHRCCSMALAPQIPWARLVLAALAFHMSSGRILSQKRMILVRTLHLRSTTPKGALHSN